MRQCGHQVREFKSHFRFRGFGTVYQLYGTNRLGLGTAEPCAEVCLHSESVRRREGSMPGLRTPLCAEKRYGAEEAIFLLEKAVDIQNFLRCAPNLHGGGHAGARAASGGVNL